jgi:predicted  nucleic acid-binding Zn-ribbon protein
MALNERETYYEQQIKEYQDNLNQVTRETEKVRVELKHIQEENDLKEKKTNDLVNELKQNYEKVQNELINLNDRGLFSFFFSSLLSYSI